MAGSPLRPQQQKQQQEDRVAESLLSSTKQHENKPRRVVRVPTAVLLGLSSAVSTCVSVLGGLFLYFEGLSMIDATVRDIGSSESLLASRILGNYFVEAQSMSGTLERILDRHGDVAERGRLQQDLKVIVDAMSLAQRRILGLGAVIVPSYDHPEQAIGQLAYWDPLTDPAALAANNNSDQLFMTISYKESHDCNPTDGYLCMVAKVMNPNGDELYNIYNYTRKWVPKNEWEWWKKHRSAWGGPWWWDSSDGTPYYYLQYQTVQVGRVPGNSSCGDCTVQMLVWVMLYDWEKDLQAIGASGEMMALEMNQGEMGSVFAATWDYHQPEECEEVLNVVAYDGCKFTIQDLRPEYREASHIVNSTMEGVITRADIRGTEFYLARRSLFSGRAHDDVARLDLVWILDSSQLKDRALEVLIYFVCFLVGVLLFDVLIFGIEVWKLAWPLRRLEMAMQFLDVMDVDRVDKEIDHLFVGRVQVSNITNLALALKNATAYLRVYRNYLPETVLPVVTTSTLDTLAVPIEVPAPGVSGTEFVCIGFTDIQGSTSLWEDSDLDMAEVLGIHDSILRAVGPAHGGYEVKTIGDSFMFAFPTPVDGCLFGLELQLLLVQQTWCDRLLEHSNASWEELPGGCPLWNGVRVRVGMHWGEVNVTQNPTTHRYDYYGSTVNMAARTESALKFGGLVGVTQQMYDAVDPATLNAHVVDLGKKELKGISTPVGILALFPKELSARDRVLQSPLAEIYIPGRSPRRSPGEVVDSMSGRNIPPGLNFGDTPVDAFSLVSEGQQSPVDELKMSKAFRAPSDGPRSRISALTSSSLACAMASVAVTKCEVWGNAESIHRLLSSQGTASLRTNGVVHSIISSFLVVTWNTGRPCADHRSRCGIYLLTEPISGQCNHGATSGQVLHGSLNASRNRFPNVLGGWVHLAWRLSDEAAHLGEYALATPPIALPFGDNCNPHRLQLWLHATGRDMNSVTQSIVWSISVPADRADQMMCFSTTVPRDNDLADDAFVKGITDEDWSSFNELPSTPDRETTIRRMVAGMVVSKDMTSAGLLEKVKRLAEAGGFSTEWSGMRPKIGILGLDLPNRQVSHSPRAHEPTGITAASTSDDWSAGAPTPKREEKSFEVEKE
eukprot:Hpha_TRINITY_DN11555_c0_g1::TRINITY_DN11555_c0_g1_i1::g.32228::m.32228